MEYTTTQPTSNHHPAVVFFVVFRHLLHCNSSSEMVRKRTVKSDPIHLAVTWRERDFVAFLNSLRFLLLQFLYFLLIIFSFLRLLFLFNVSLRHLILWRWRRHRDHFSALPLLFSCSCILRSGLSKCVGRRWVVRRMNEHEKKKKKKNVFGDNR